MVLPSNSTRRVAFSGCATAGRGKLHTDSCPGPAGKGVGLLSMPGAFWLLEAQTVLLWLSEAQTVSCGAANMCAAVMLRQIRRCRAVHATGRLPRRLTCIGDTDANVGRTEHACLMHT